MKLIPSLGKTIFESASDIAIDALDAGLDELADNLLSNELSILSPLIQDLPVVRYFITIGKTALAVKEYRFIKKSLRFLVQFKNGTAKEKALEKRRIALQKHEKWVYQELEQIVVALDRLDEEVKAKAIAEIYKAYLNEEFSSNSRLNEYEFHDFCCITERLFMLDILQIRADYESEKAKKRNEEAHWEMCVTTTTRYKEILGRLLALGLMNISAKVGSGVHVNTDMLEYEVSSRGKKYAEILSRVDFLGISPDIYITKE